jgi:hypothetical protein
VLAVSGVTGRVWTDGMNYSNRVWALNQQTQNSINSIITSGIARGQSAVSMAKDLTSFLVNPTLTAGTTWTTAITKSVSGRGTVNYNALRLARSEINNTYREALIESNEASPITLCVHWNLSVSHKIRDICDVWAGVDQYGFGGGNYPAAQTPIDHPNGRCYLTDVLNEISQWGKPKQTNYQSKNISDEKIVSLLGKDAKDGAKNAAVKAFKNMNSLLNSNSNSNNKLYKKAS